MTDEMIVTVTIYKVIYDGSFDTGYEVETITGTKSDILKRFEEIKKTHPAERFFYIME